MPGNLEWAYPRRQNNQQMFKIIAQQKHKLKHLQSLLPGGEFSHVSYSMVRGAT